MPDSIEFKQCPGYGGRTCIATIPADRILCHFCTRTKQGANADSFGVVACICGALAGPEHEISDRHLLWRRVSL